MGFGCGACLSKRRLEVLEGRGGGGVEVGGALHFGREGHGAPPCLPPAPDPPYLPSLSPSTRSHATLLLLTHSPRTHDSHQKETLRGLPGIGRLLYGAASRLERGASTCLSCKGTGTIDCPACAGSGLVTSPRQAGKGLLRKVVGKLKAAVGRGGGSSAAGDAAFILSNRCRRCHGLGRCTCGACGGMGVRASLRRPGDPRP